MENNQIVNTLGLSPQELSGISEQQISRNKNMINLIGKALTHKVSSAKQISDAERNRVLNKLTAAQTKELEPVDIEFRGKKFQTTRKNMTQAMKDLRESFIKDQAIERTAYENEPMQLNVGGQNYDMRRFELEGMLKNLTKLEEIELKDRAENRLKKTQDIRLEGIAEFKKLEDQGLAKDLSTIPISTLTKIGGGGVAAWINNKKPPAENNLAREKFNLDLRKTLMSLHKELNNPKSNNPVALADSANKITEELGETIFKVVFPKGVVIPGWMNDISKGVYNMENLRNPMTNEKITIKELREQAEADDMSLNEVLQILYIQNRLKNLKKKKD